MRKRFGRRRERARLRLKDWWERYGVREAVSEAEVDKRIDVYRSRRGRGRSSPTRADWA